MLIDKEALPALRAQSEMVRETLAEIKGREQEVAQAHKKQQELAEQIRKSEASASGMDDKGFEALDRKRRQFEALIPHMMELEDGAQAGRGKLSARMGFLRVAFEAAVKPGYDVLIERATAAMRPYYRDESWARQAAKQSDAAMAYGGFINQQWGQTTSEAAVTEAEYALKLVAELLEGRNPFRMGDLTLE